MRRRVDSGWLTRLHPGVFSFGAPTDLARIDAALRACGPDATATAWSAAAMDDLLPFPAAVHVTNRRGGPRPKAVRVSQPRVPPDWILRHGLRCTTVPETLLALAAAHYGDARDATDRAFILRKTSTEQLTHLARLFFKLLEDARLPLPQVNVKVNGHLVDFWWPEHRLIVETDGWASHGRRRQFEEDRRRDLDHAAEGILTIRVTYLQRTRESPAVCARLGAALLRAAA